MNSKTKGQIKQAFIYILFIVGAGFVLLMGYNIVSNLTSQACDASRAEFKQEITSYFDQYTSYGSVHKESVDLPCNYDAVCFVNNSFSPGLNYATKGANGYGFEPVPSKKSVVANALQQEDANIFLMGQFMEPTAYSEKVVTEGSVEAFCIKSGSGVINLQFEGQGDKTLVKPES